MAKRPTLRRPIAIGTAAIAGAVAVLIAVNVAATRQFLLFDEVGSVAELPSAYWLVVAVIDVLLCAIVAALLLFVVSNAQAILQMRRQDTFIDGVTHELKSPLASVRLALDTLESRDVPPHVRDTLMGQMRVDVDRLQLFIEHILEAGRLEHGERSFELENVDVSELAWRCAEQIERRHDLREGELVLRADEPVVVRTDPVAVEIAVLNLLDNAVKYVGDPRRDATDATRPEVSEMRPKVVLEVSRVGREVRIEVTDEGVGLTPAQRKRIFNRFYRVAQTRKVRGTGLGLYVSRGLIRRLGGDLVAESEGPGRGARFIVSLPTRDAA